MSSIWSKTCDQYVKTCDLCDYSNVSSLASISTQAFVKMLQNWISQTSQLLLSALDVYLKFDRRPFRSTAKKPNRLFKRFAWILNRDWKDKGFVEQVWSQTGKKITYQRCDNEKEFSSSDFEEYTVCKIFRTWILNQMELRKEISALPLTWGTLCSRVLECPRIYEQKL